MRRGVGRISRNFTHSPVTVIPKRMPREKKLGGRFAGIAALGLILCLVPCAHSEAAILVPATPADAGRIDYQTVIVRPSSENALARVTIFCAFRLRRPVSGSGEASLLIPVDGLPESAVAQAVALDRFDRTATHAADLEKAFYDEARMTRRGRVCLATAIGAGGGLPAWLLLAPRWPPRAPPLTAVVHAPSAADEALPVVKTIRVVPTQQYMRLSADRLEPRTLEALRPFRRGSMIVVEFSAPAESDASYRRAAATGIRVTYEAPIPRSDSSPSLRLPTTTALEAPALTRIYVAAHWRQEVFFEGIRFDEDAPSPQKIADDATALSGLPEWARRSRLARTACARRSSTLTVSGDRTLRVVVRGRDLPDVRVHIENSGAGALRATGTAVGTILYGLLWPLTAAAYLAALWLALRVYLWLISSPVPPEWRRAYVLSVALSPLLTLWFLLRYVRRPWPPSDDGNRSGALGVLSMATYDCVARLVVWALVVCSTWVVVRTLAGVAARLRFG